MNFEQVKQSIEQWLAPVLAEKDFFLVDVRFSRGKCIEVYVDSDEGIHIDDCAFISRQLEQHLDGSGLVPENYILEVSSPGMGNPLKVPRQYKKRIGRMLEVVKTSGERIEAQLTEVTGNGIKLREAALENKKKGGKKAEEILPAPKEYELNFADIKKAVVQFRF